MIKGSSREKLHRMLIGAFLQSSIPLRDLREIISKIEHDPSFLAELADMMRPIVGRLSDLHHPEGPPDVVAVTDQVQEILDLIAARRFSKNDVMKIISLIDPRERSGATRRTMQELVKDFYERATVSQLHKFTRALSDEGAEDPYLKIIRGRP